MTGFKNVEAHNIENADELNSPVLWLCRCFIAYFLSFLLIFQPVVSYADNGIVVDTHAPASQQAGLDKAQNGVPVVNITNPSAGGVSRNTFTDFNVDSKGVIMNNSLTVGVSQLGGALPGNPNFTGGQTARIILNEVSGTGRSNINGATEIFGDRAQYVLANPNGITCNGCGFINTPRVTLSTGTADIGADGSLKGLNVTGGDVKFEGLDVNATNLDSFDIISRTASFASSVYAGSELNVITGSNYVDYNTKVATPVSAGSAAPQVGLDSSALGGMYAGKINLVATEAGVGVNTQGTLGASSSDIKITADGRIEFKDANAKGNIKVTSTSGSVKHSGNSYSEGNTEINAAQGVELADGFTAAKGDVKINSATLDENSAASVMAGVDAITTGNNIAFTDNGMGILDVQTTGTATNAGTMSGSSITANSGSFNNTGMVQSSGDITISASSISNLNNYITDSNGNVTGGISSGGKLTLTSTSGNIDNTGGMLTSSGLFTITSTGSLVNNSLINSSSNILINAASLDNRNSYNTNSSGYLTSGILAGGNIGITTISGGINNSAGAISGNAITLNSAGQLTNDSGLVNSAMTIDTTAVGVSNNSGGILASGDVKINAGSGNVSNTAGVINTSANIDVNHAAAFSNTGLVSGAASTSISANSINNNNSYNTNANGALTTGILSNGDVNLTAATGDISNAAGVVYGKNLTLNSAGQLDNTAGLVQATNTASIIATGINNSATYIKNAFGTLVKGILATSDITIAGGSGDINNANGAINSGGKVTATTTGAVTNSGLVQSAGDTSVTAGSITNSNNYHTDTNGNLDKGILSGGKLDVTTTGNATNTGGALYSSDKLTVTSSGNVANTGLVASGNNIGITGAGVSNSGSIITGNDVLLTANTGDINNSGEISGNNVGITANSSNFDNTGGLSQSTGTTTINSKGLVNNNTFNAATNTTTQGQIISDGDLTANIGSNGVSNQGLVATSGKADITATNGDVTNTGLVESAGNLTVKANNIDNSNSTGLISNQNINLTASGTIKNIAGYIAARNITATSAGKFYNTSGTVRSNLNTSINAAGIDNSDTYITDNSGNIIAGILAGGTITLAGNTGNITSDNGAIIGTGNIVLTADGEILNSGLIQGTHDITLTSGTIDNSNSYFTDNSGTLIGGILAGGNANLTTNNGYIKNINGAISAVNNNITASGTFDNNSGFSQSSGTTTINSASVINDNSYLVNNSGNIVGGIISNGDLSVNTGIFSNSDGAVIGNSKVTVTGTGAFTNSGLVKSTYDLKITASSINNDNSYATSNGSLVGGLISGGKADLTATSGNITNTLGAIKSTLALTISAIGQFVNNNLVRSGGNININAASVDNSGSYGTDANGALNKGIIADGDVAVTASSGNVNNSSGAIVGDNVNVNSTAAFNNNSGLVNANNTVTANAASIDNSSGEISTNGNINLTANSGTIKNDSGALYGNNITATSSGKFSNIIGLVNAGGFISVNAAGIDNSNTYLTYADGSLAAGMLAGSTINLNGNNANVVNSGGAISAGGIITISTNADVINSGLVQGDSDINVNAANIDNSGSYITSNGSLAGGIMAGGNANLTASANINNASGAVTANNINISAPGQFNNNAGFTQSAAKTTITANGISNDNTYVTNSNGTIIKGIISGGDLSTTSNSFSNSTGAIVGLSKVTVANAGNFSNSGLIKSSGALNVTSGAIDNSGSLVSSSTAVLNATSGDINNSGTISSALSLAISAIGQFINNSLVRAGSNTVVSDITINAAGVDNSGSYGLDSNGALNKGIIASGNIAINANAGNVKNNSGAIVGNNVNVTNTAAFTNDSGFVKSTTDTNITAASIDNSNSKGIFANGDANLNATGTIKNNAGVVSSDNINITGGSSFSNIAGVLSSARDIVIHALGIDNSSTYATNNGALTSGILAGGKVTMDGKTGDIVNTNGAISSSDNASITTSGQVVNSGLVQSDKNVTVTASAIDNSGSYATDSNGAAIKGIIAGLSAIITASGGAINNYSGGIVAGNLNVTASGSFTNTAGLSQSSGTTTINASGVNNDNTYVTDSNGYLTKGIISGGDLTATTDAGGFSNSNGAVAGSGKVTIATIGNFTNSGLINAANALKITAANINNINSYLLTNGSLAKGLISNSTIDLSATAGDIVNTGGAVSSAGNLTLSATGQLLNNSLVQSGGNITVNAASVNNSGSYAVDGSGNLNKGMLATGNISITSGAINNTSGAIAGNNITATGTGSFTNTGGLVQGNTDTTINAASIDNTSTEVVNSSGTITKGILTGGILTLTSTSGDIDNTDGALSSGGNTVINSAGLFSNHSLVQSGGNLNITAAGIDNSNSYAVTNGSLTGGLIASGTITLNAGTYDIINENGAISAGKTFSLSAVNVDNNSGYISANGVTGTSLVIAANVVDNQSGSILSKANLNISGSSGDNTAGAVISANNALNITIASGGELDNTGGDIYSSNGSITGQNIDNSGGRIQAANQVTITQTGGIFDNTNGTVLAFANGSTVVINAAQNILNQGGNIISIQNTDLNLGSAYTITGTLTTGGHVDITATSITNNAVVNAGDYINLVTTSGDITNNSGGQLISGTLITLSSNGSLYNYGVISGPAITIAATNGGVYNYNEITSAGTLDITANNSSVNNYSRISSEGVANISANSLNNSSAQIASNDDLNITTSGSISNSGGGLLYATNDLALHTSSLNNTSAYIFSLDGNVTLDKTAGVRNSSITNTSGSIEAFSGDVNIYTNSLTNNRTSYQYVQAPLRDSNGNFSFSNAMFALADSHTYATDGVYYEKNRWYYNIKGSNGAAGQILSGRDINLNAASTYNNAGQIAANRNITITGGSVTNQAYLVQSWEIAEGNYWRGPTYWFNSIDSPGSLNLEDPNYVPTTAIVASSITAGNNISGSVSNLNNATSGNGSASLSSQSANLSTSSLPGSAQVVAVNNNQLNQNQANAGAGSSGGSNIQLQGGVGSSNISTAQIQSGVGIASGNNGSVQVGIGQASISAGVQQSGVSISSAPVLSAQSGIVQGNSATSSTQSGVIAVSSTTGVLSAAQTQNATSTTITSVSSPVALAVNVINNLPTSSSGLFKPATTPACNCVIETNVAFIDQSKFLGSDYFLTRIGYVPPSSQKLLGDAFYTTQLVRQQIFEKTAQRYIEHGISTDLGQMQALMDNAVTEKSALNLSIGIELSATQIASLSSDIIWLVDQVIDGQHALVPVVYLAQATLDGLSGNPANISAGNDLAIAASDSIENSGAITAGHNVSLTAGNNITNIGGLIKAGNNVTLVSTNGDIINQAMVQSAGLGTTSRISQFIASQGNIQAGGNVALNAANNITNTASNITSGGNTALTAGGDITIETAALRNRTESGGYRYSRVDDTTTNVVSNISSSGTFTANAGNNIAIAGSDITATGNTNLTAANNITIAAVQDTATHSVQTSKKGSFGSSSTYSKSTYDLNNKSATVASTGGDVNINAGNNVADLASIVTSAGNTNINAGNQVTIASLSDAHEVHESTTKKSGLLAKALTGGLAMDWLGLSKKDTNTSKDTIQTTVISSNTTAGGNLSSSSGGDTNIVASKLSAGGNVNITAGGAATIASSSNTDYTETKDSTKSMMWQTSSDTGHANSTVVNTEITSGGTTNISAAGGVTADVKNLTGDVQKDIATLSQQPGMAYLATIQNNPNAKFNQVNDAAKAWDYKSQGLTQEGAAIIAIAVTIATMGAGTGAALASTAATTATGATTAVAVTGAAAAASNAAFAALASQAAVSLANNKGDVGKTLHDLADSQTVKNMAFAAVTAGTTQYAGEALGYINTAAGGNPSMYTTQAGTNTSINIMDQATSSLSYGQQATKVLVNASVNSAAQTAIYGGNLGSNFTDSLKTAAVYAVGANAADTIGDMHVANPTQTGELIAITSHAALGCAVGAASSGNCGAGAIGGAVGEFAAEKAYQNGSNISTSQNIGQYAAVGAALVSGQDAKGIYTANGTAVNAMENNLVGHVAALAIATAYVAYVGDGDPKAGLAKIAKGEDPVSQALSSGAQKTIEFSNDKAPETTQAMLSALGKAGVAVNATVTYVDDKTGNIVSGQWNSLDESTRNYIVGGAKVISVAMPAGAMAEMGIVKATGAASVTENVAASTASDVYHVTKTSASTESVLNGIDTKFTDPASRFGQGFYTSYNADTALAEATQKGTSAANGIRYSVNENALNTLDLTNPQTAAQWGYAGGEKSTQMLTIGQQAQSQGYNAIRFNSEQGSGINLVIYNNFENALTPQMVTPIK